jgi:hypothetical protein
MPTTPNGARDAPYAGEVSEGHVPGGEVAAADVADLALATKVYQPMGLGPNDHLGAISCVRSHPASLAAHTQLFDGHLDPDGSSRCESS